MVKRFLLPYNPRQVLQLQLIKMKQQNALFLQRLQKQFQNKLNAAIDSLTSSKSNNIISSVTNDTNDVNNSDSYVIPDAVKFFYTISAKVSYNPIIPPTSFSGAQLRALYNIPTIVPSSPTTRIVVVAIIIAYHCPTLQSDLNTYWQSHFNFGPSSTPPKVNVYTFPGAKVNSSWNVETCLDVQMVATVNPNANIWVIEAKSNSIYDITLAVQYATTKLNNGNGADILSMSWGCRDSSILDNRNNFFINPNPMNPSNFKCFCASSGDNNFVNWPSVLSNVVSVGGTTLVWNPISSNLNARSEYTWTSAGCGYSTCVAKPLYQNTINPTATYRAIPDLSLIANPTTGVSIVYNGKWNKTGGTSVSCPLFAGILSLANQMRFNAGKNPLTTVYTQSPTVNVNPPLSLIPKTHIQSYLYQNIYTNPTLKSSCLTDITIGTDGDYNAGSGYDIATGVGSPNATELCNSLENI